MPGSGVTRLGVPRERRWGLSITRGPSGTDGAPRAPRAPRSDPTGTWGASPLLPVGFTSTTSHSDGEGPTMEGGSEGPSTFPVPHKEEPEAAKLSAAFKKLLSRKPMTRSALGRPQRHETSLQAAGRQGAPPAPPGQGPRPREHWPEPSPGHPGGFLPGDVRHPARGGGEESFAFAPGRRHVPAHCINIYSPHSYLLFDISHGPRPPRPPVGH